MFKCSLVYLFFISYQTTASDLIKLGIKPIRYRQSWYYISRALDKINRDDDNHNLYKWYGLKVGPRLNGTLREIMSLDGIYDVSSFYDDGSGHAMLLVVDPINKCCLFVEPNVGIYIFDTNEDGINGIEAFLRPGRYCDLKRGIKYLKLFLPQGCNLCAAYVAQVAYLFLKDPITDWENLSPAKLYLKDFDPFPKFLLEAEDFVEKGDNEKAFWLLSRAFFLLPKHIQSRFNEVQRLKEKIKNLIDKKHNQKNISNRKRGRGAKTMPSLDQQIEDGQELLKEKLEKLSKSNFIEDRIYYLRHKIAQSLGKDDLFIMTSMEDFLMDYSHSDVDNICSFTIRKVTTI